MNAPTSPAAPQSTKSGRKATNASQPRCHTCRKFVRRGAFRCHTCDLQALTTHYTPVTVPSWRTLPAMPCEPSEAYTRTRRVVALLALALAPLAVWACL